MKRYQSIYHLAYMLSWPGVILLTIVVQIGDWSFTTRAIVVAIQLFVMSGLTMIYLLGCQQLRSYADE